MPNLAFHHRLCFEKLEDRCVLSAQSILDATLVNDEAAVRAMLGPDLLTLGGGEDIGSTLLLEDLAKLAIRGYAPGHNFTSFRGIGLAFGKLAALGDGYVPQLGEPTVLFYRPTAIFDTTDVVPDPPYEFIGWAYAFDYDPRDVPSMAGFPADAWQVHEAGIHHTFDGGFTPTPPVEEHHGSGDMESRPDDPSLPVGIFHERLWNISFYTDPNGGPARTAIHDPFGRVPEGFPNGEESFFFPEIPFTGNPQPASRVEAEDFDMAEGFGWLDSTPGNRGGQGDYRLTGVDLTPTFDFNGGQDVTQTALDEILRYTIDVPSPGLHEFGFRVSNDDAAAQFRVRVDGVAAGTFAIPTTATSFAYTTFEPFALDLSAGVHRVEIHFLSTPPAGVVGPRLNHFYVRPETPTAHLTPIPDVTGAGLEFTEFTVTYRDDDAIDRATLDNADVRVRQVGGEYNVLATLMSVTPNASFNELIAVYRVDAPDDTWDPSDRGEYQVLLQAGQVRDEGAIAVPGGVLGSFQVAVPFFEQIPIPRDVDEVRIVVAGLDIADEIRIVNVGDFLDILIDNVATERFPLKGIGEIVVFANGGDDVVSAAGVSIPFVMRGGPGDDELIGGERGDVLHGEDGNDLLDGRGGIDTMLGGRGDDKAVLTRDRDVIDLGDGRDGVVVEGTSRHDVITVQRRVAADGPEVLVRVNGVLFTAAYRNGETVTVSGGAGNDVIMAVGETTWGMEFSGGDGNDVLIGGNRDDVLDGGAGHDVINGREGADRIRAGDGTADVLLLDPDDVLASRDPRDLVVPVRRGRRG